MHLSTMSYLRALLCIVVFVEIKDYIALGAAVLDCVSKENCRTNPSQPIVAHDGSIDTLTDADLTESKESKISTRHDELKKGQLYPVAPPRRSRRNLIVPGTSWCGVGNNSRDNVSNGASDQCCRDHDHCPYTINGFSRKYNMYNYRFYTISHCECDDIFRTCLRMANRGLNSQALLIGEFYFNYIGMKCFIFTRETVCAEREWYGKCRRETTQWAAELRDPLTF